uniref:IS66 family transposase n=1 Tax=Paraburkholderia caledonica TaxID=134536 RepID=UPI0038CD94A6
MASSRLPATWWELAPPLLDAFEIWLRSTLSTVSQKGDTAKAINYEPNQWAALTLYVDDGAVEIDNNAAEPVFYCGLSAFGSWAAHLVGQPVGSNPESGITVAVDERDVALAGLLVSKGWLQPPMLDDEAQAAITERRGGCPFISLRQSNVQDHRQSRSRFHAFRLRRYRLRFAEYVPAV